MIKRIVSVCLACVLLLTGCQLGRSEGEETSPTDDGTVGTTVSVDFAQSKEDMFSSKDEKTEHHYDTHTTIYLNGTTASCSSDAVRIDGGIVTVTDEGTYVFEGALTDGRIVVDADESDKPQLILNGVSVTSATSAALYILEADKVFVTLTDGTENSLVNGGSFVAVDGNNVDGAVFSKQDLTFNGSGKLVVTSPAGHGIVCKDDLVFAGGEYAVTCASHGMDANDSVRIESGRFTLDTGKDGIHAEHEEDASLGFVYIHDGTLTVEAEGDGISASYYVQIEDGSFDILCGGGAQNASKQTSDGWGGFMGGYGGGAASDTADDGTSMKGIKCAGSLLINGGVYTIDAADDAVHANTSIVVNGGTFAVKTGDDGFHADETLAVGGGTVTISESYEGLEALNVSVSGGTVTVVADDDGINAAGGADQSGAGGKRPGGDRFGPGGPGGSSSSSKGSIVIAGGTVNITASGDGIDANGTLSITGGVTTVCGPTQGDTATLDYDVSATISGGTFIGSGASGMAQTFSSSPQGVVAVRVGDQSAQTTVTLKNAQGKTLLTHTPPLPFSVIILSSPEIAAGESYTLTVGTESATVTAN